MTKESQMASRRFRRWEARWSRLPGRPIWPRLCSVANFSKPPPYLGLGSHGEDTWVSPRRQADSQVRCTADLASSVRDSSRRSETHGQAAGNSYSSIWERSIAGPMSKTAASQHACPF